MDNYTEFRCPQCNKGFRSKESLRGHCNKQTRCKNKEKERLAKLEVQNESQIVEEARRVVGDGEEAEVFHHIEEREITDQWDNNIQNEDNINFQLYNFDSALSLASAFTYCVGGRGQSESDITQILKVLHHPLFDINQVPYKNGRGCKSWLKRKLEAENGLLEVIFFFTMFSECIFVILLY